MRLSVAVAMACLSMTGLSVADPAQAAIRRTTNIPAQGLAPALQLFAKEREIQLVYRSDLVGDRQTPGASGELTIEEALTKLLSGTGLTFQYLEDKGITIVPVPVAGARSSAVMPAAASGSATAAEERSRGFWSRLRLAQAEAATGSRASRQDEAGAGAQAPGTAPAARGSLEEIIVTAQKREEKLQDVPTAIAVLSAAKLEAQGVTQLADYAKQVPGLRLIGAGAPGSGKPVLRGVSTGSDLNSLVGVYLDDMPFTPSSYRAFQAGLSFDPSLADIERIEVLKGPQSTLYGASALGGLIKFVTKRPDPNAFESSLRVDGSQVDGGDYGYGMRASVNLPIAQDKIGARVSAFYREDPGFLDNPARDEHDVNSNTVNGGRFSVLAKLTDTLETTFVGLMQNMELDAPYAVFLNPTTLQPTLGDLAFASPLDQPRTTKYRLLGNTTTWDLSFATLTNIASYVELDVDSINDWTTTGVAFGVSGALYREELNSRRYSDELRLTSAPGRFEWMLGGFYTDEKDVRLFNARGTDASGTILPPANAAFNIYTYNNIVSFKESAVFGNVTFHFTDRFEATLGARYNSNDQDFSLVTTGRLGVNPPGNIGHPTSDSSANYLATASYKPQDNLTIYVRAASAYRPGGPNALNETQRALGLPLLFESDTLWNYEAGIRGNAWNGALAYSASAYYMDWSDIQITVITVINGTPLGTIGNAAKAKSEGVELSLDVEPIDGLIIGLNGAYNDAKIASNAASLSAFDGDRLPYAPEITLSAVLDYEWTVSTGFTPHFGLTYSYSSDQDTAFPASANAFELPSYATLDVRAGIDWSQYSLVARVDNVTDKYAVTSAGPSSFAGAPTVGTVLRPRTFGLSFEARF